MKEKLMLLTVQQFVLLLYLSITTIVFFVAMAHGNEGVTIRLFGGGDDGLFYWIQAQNVASGREAVLTSIYPLIIGYIVKITGAETVYVIRLFNYLGFILLVLFSIKLVEQQFSIETNGLESKSINVSKVLLLLAFLVYPSLQMYANLSIYRDIWIYTLYVVSTLLAIRLMFFKRKRMIYIPVFLFSLWLLGEFRDYALMAFILAAAIYFIYKKALFFMKPLGFAFFLALLFGSYYTVGMDFRVPIVDMTLRGALNYRHGGISTYAGGSQMWISLEQPNYPLFLLHYIYSYIGNLIGPLPWHIYGFSTLIVFFAESTPMAFILRFLWRTRSLLSDMQRYILLHAFTWASLIAITNDNIGTATRLRLVSWILILIVFVVVYGKDRYLKRNRKMSLNGGE